MSRRFLALVAVIWVPLLLWWVALLPGGISNDTIDSWTQIQTGQWTDHHPPPFTAYMWLTSLGGTTLATTSLVDTLVIAVAMAFLATVLAHVLRVGRAVYVAAFLLVLLPLVGPFSVTIWKDIPETAALFGLISLLVLGCHRDGPLPRRWWAGVVACSLVAGLLRWNGGATTAVAGVVVAVALTGSRRWWAALATAAAGLAGTAVLLLLPHVAPIQPLQPIDTQAEKLADLAQFARNAPQSLTRHDRAVLRAIAPLPDWRRAAQTCLTVDTVTYYLIRYNDREGALDAESAEVSAVWSHAARKAPVTLLRARTCRASLAWSLADPPRRELLTVQPDVAPNTVGLHASGPRPLRDAARDVADVSQQRWVQELFWRPALWLLLTVAAGLAGGLRRGRWRLVLTALAVPLGVVISYAAQPAAQDARYTYAATVACQLAVVALVADRVRGGAASGPAAAPPVAEPVATEAVG